MLTCTHYILITFYSYPVGKARMSRTQLQTVCQINKYKLSVLSATAVQRLPTKERLPVLLNLISDLTCFKARLVQWEREDAFWGCGKQASLVLRPHRYLCFNGDNKRWPLTHSTSCNVKAEKPHLISALTWVNSLQFVQLSTLLPGQHLPLPHSECVKQSCHLDGSDEGRVLEQQIRRPSPDVKVVTFRVEMTLRRPELYSKQVATQALVNC